MGQCRQLRTMLGQRRVGHRKMCRPDNKSVLNSGEEFCGAEIEADDSDGRLQSSPIRFFRGIYFATDLFYTSGGRDDYLPPSGFGLDPVLLF